MWIYDPHMEITWRLWAPDLCAIKMEVEKSETWLRKISTHRKRDKDQWSLLSIMSQFRADFLLRKIYSHLSWNVY